MAILIADGFEDTAEADYPNSTSSISAGNGRRGGKALMMNSSSGTEVLGISGSPSTVFAHVAVNPNNRSGIIFAFTETGTTLAHVLIARSQDGAVIAYRNTIANVLGTSVPGVIPITGYTSIQCKVVIHDTTGSVEVRLNGSTTPVLILTNVDTRNAGTGVCNNLVLGWISSDGIGGTAYWDDVVVWDTTGSVNNSWLGDLRVDSYMPNADGDTTTMTPSTGTSHYALVDEVPFSDTDYNGSATVGNKDLYHTTNMSHTPETVHAVIAFARALKDDAGSREMAVIAKSNTTEVEGTSTALTTGSSVRLTHVMETNPDGGGAWTKSAVDALQVGAKVSA